MPKYAAHALSTHDTLSIHRVPGIVENTYFERTALYPLVSALVDSSKNPDVLNQYFRDMPKNARNYLEPKEDITGKCVYDRLAADIHVLLSYFDSRANVINHYAQVVQLRQSAAGAILSRALSHLNRYRFLFSWPLFRSVQLLQAVHR
jgi:hypothetical protein